MTDLAAWAKPATSAASERGFQAWNFDEALAIGSGAAPTSQVIGGRLRYSGGVISSVYFLCSNALIGGVAGNFAGIYSPAGVLLAQTADLTTAWASLPTGGLAPAPLTAPITLAPGFYDVAVLFNQSGGLVPQMMRVTSATGQLAGIGANGTPPRSWQADTGRTSLPAVLGTKSARGFAEWLAIA